MDFPTAVLSKEEEELPTVVFGGLKKKVWLAVNTLRLMYPSFEGDERIRAKGDW